jgi:hypothetical protein
MPAISYSTPTFQNEKVKNTVKMNLRNLIKKRVSTFRVQEPKKGKRLKKKKQETNYPICNYPGAPDN